jgi:hypothetical protein
MIMLFDLRQVEKPVMPPRGVDRLFRRAHGATKTLGRIVRTANLAPSSEPRLNAVAVPDTATFAREKNIATPNKLPVRFWHAKQ